MTNTAFKSYPVSGFTFPSGRVMTNSFDSLYRRTLAHDTTSSYDIAAWQFIGPGRIAEVALGNGLICTWMNDARTHSAVQAPTTTNPAGVPNPPWVAPPSGQSADRLGYDGAGRAITKRYLAGGINGTTHAYNTPTSVVGFTTAFDRAGNKFYERALHAENRSHLYEPFDSNGLPTGGYDSLDRLLQYQRGTLASTGGSGGNGGGSIALSGSTPLYIAVPNTDWTRAYELDGLGNWRRTTFTPQTTGTPVLQTEVRQHNGLNQITRRSNPSATLLVNPTYDKNGNLTFDGTLTYTWDALNRLASADEGDTNLGAYNYDALNRRVRKTVEQHGHRLRLQRLAVRRGAEPRRGKRGHADDAIRLGHLSRRVDPTIAASCDQRISRQFAALSLAGPVVSHDRPCGLVGDGPRGLRQRRLRQHADFPQQRQPAGPDYLRKHGPAGRLAHLSLHLHRPAI